MGKLITKGHLVPQHKYISNNRVYTIQINVWGRINDTRGIQNQGPRVQSQGETQSEAERKEALESIRLEAIPNI